MSNNSILVCAAGKSSRTPGLDKLLTVIDGEPLVRRQIRAACELEANVTAVFSADNLTRVKAASGVAENNIVIGSSAEGLSGTLRGSVEQLPDNTDHLMVVLADMPSVTPVTMARMMRAPRDFPGAKIWRPVDVDGNPGHPVVFHKSVFKDFANISGDNGAKEILEKHKVQNVEFPDHSVTLDLDTEEDINSFLDAHAARDKKKRKKSKK